MNTLLVVGAALGLIFYAVGLGYYVAFVRESCRRRGFQKWHLFLRVWFSDSRRRFQLTARERSLKRRSSILMFLAFAVAAAPIAIPLIAFLVALVSKS